MNIARRLCFLLGFFFVLSQVLLLKPNAFAQDTDRLSADTVLREINLARENPRLYAAFVQESRPSHMIEHGRAVDEAVRFLTKTRPLGPLKLSPGMCRAAADHCAEQAGGQMGHSGNGRTSPGDRLNRYGSWLAAYGENISYGRKTSREVVVALIVDDGTRSRGHRKNIFNPKFTIAGVATGPHARLGTICTTDFAGAYAERGEALVAHNP
jgi:uncharacterized protein YkwD